MKAKFYFMGNMYVPKVGDIITIIRGETNWNSWTMDKWIGSTQKISVMKYDSKGVHVEFECEGSDKEINSWYWRPEHMKPYDRPNKIIKLKFR